MSVTELTLEQAQQMMLYISQKMQESKDLLSHADQVIGDGDHGIGMARGFESVEEKLSHSSYSNCSELFKNIGMTLLSTIGGAAGAVFGSLFMGMGKGLSDVQVINETNLSVALQAGLELIQKRGGAKVGDKTMIDALSPAVDAASDGKDLSMGEFLEKISLAAEEGKEKTKDMVSKIGKSKTQGERSLGFPDPGAISVTLIFKFMHEYVSSIQ